MADKVLSAQPAKLGHTFLNAMWIAGFLAILQIVAVAVAVIKRTPAADQPVVTTSPPALSVPADTEPLPNLESTPVTTPPAETVTNAAGTPESSETTSNIARFPAPDFSEVSDPVGKIDDSLISRLVETGIDDRRRGDLAGALEALHDADENLPGHPRILSELAGTYGELGRMAEAEEYWRRVAAMGRIVAGSFYQTADKVLRGEDPTIPEVELGKYLKLGKVRVRKLPVSAEGEKVSLLIPIIGKAGEKLAAKDLDMRVYFYDLINGKTPGATTATTSWDYPSHPYDWQERRTEELEIIYHQPVFTVEQKRNLGERVYFGYVIELYYRNQLQDSVVSSDQLRSLRFPVSEPVEEPPPPQGPDTSLFPINR